MGEHPSEGLTPFEEPGALFSRAAAGEPPGSFPGRRETALVDETIQL